jgi:hypothetical protein
MQAKENLVRSSTVGVVWAVGLVVAALIYVMGPDDALATLFAWADQAGAALQHAVAELGGRAFDILRALAIGCFAVFFALCVIAAGRGQSTVWLMLWVSALFLLLVWHEGREATGHWTLAFLLAAAAALNVTRRLEGRPLSLQQE